MAKKKIDFSFFALNFSRKNEMKKLRKPKIFVFHGFMETKSVSHQICLFASHLETEKIFQFYSAMSLSVEFTNPMLKSAR